jgi:hypothetical protein
MAQGAAVTDVGVAAGGLGIAAGAAIVQFNKASVTPSLITMTPAPAGTLTVRFPVYTKHDPTNATYGVDEHADGAEETIANLTNIETTAVDCKVLRRAIRAEITDLAVHGNGDALLANAGAQLGNDVARKFDAEVCALFDGFATAKGTSTKGCRFLDIADCIASLEANDAPRPYAAVLHPQQVWGDFGLTNEFGITSNNESNGVFNGLDSVAGQFIGSGFVTNIAGVNIFTSTAVPNGGDATEKKAGVFAKTALGCGFKDSGNGSFIELRSEREEAYAKTTIVANGYWAVSELVDLHGCELHTEIS